VLTILVTAALVAAPAQATPPTHARCPVQGCKVTAKDPTAVVRGRSYSVCCAMCKAELEKHPDKYLNKDGTPKNQ